MADDAVAGIYGNLALRLIIWVACQWSPEGDAWLRVPRVSHVTRERRGAGHYTASDEDGATMRR